jgi:hypothetical protein
MSFRSLALTSSGCLLAVVACRSHATEVTEQVQPLDATLALVRYDGQSLPVDQGPIPPAPHTGTFNPSCRFQLRDGSLEVHVPVSWFHLQYNIYNTCGNYRISWEDLWGRVTQTGRALRLDEGSRGTLVLNGLITRDVVTIIYSGIGLEFR